MRLLELASLVVLMWVLDEHQMGVAALSWSVAVFLEAYAGVGIGTAVVQARDLTQEQRDGALYFSVATGVALFVAAVLTAPAIAGFFAEAELEAMVPVAASRLLWAGASTVPRHLLARDLRFRTVALVESGALGVSAALKVALAFAGFGAWSLVLGHAAEGLAILLGCWITAGFRPRSPWNIAATRPLVVFGVKVAASRVVYHGYRNLDYFVVGRVFGAEALGVYRVGFEIAMSPAMAVLNVLNGAAFPVYSRLADARDELARAYLWTQRTFVVWMGPLAVFVWFLAPQLVPLFGGDKWLGAVALVRILSWAALLRCMAHLVPQVLHAAGRPDLAVWDSLATLGSLAVAFLALTLVVPGLGSAAMAWGWLLAYPGLLLLLYVFARRAVPLRAGAWWLSLLPGILAMALSAAILFVVDALLPPGGAPWMRLALGAGGTLGAVILCARSGLAR